MDNVFCEKCGSKITAGNAFCDSCGSPVNAQGIPQANMQQAPQQKVQQTPQQNAPQNYGQYSQQVPQQNAPQNYGQNMYQNQQQYSQQIPQQNMQQGQQQYSQQIPQQNMQQGQQKKDSANLASNLNKIFGKSFMPYVMIGIAVLGFLVLFAVNAWAGGILYFIAAILSGVEIFVRYKNSQLPSMGSYIDVSFKSKDKGFIILFLLIILVPVIFIITLYRYTQETVETVYVSPYDYYWYW